MTFARGYAQNGPLRMYYEVHGDTRPGRVPLLLVHGGGSTIDSNFRHLIPVLAETRQVIAVEEEGHGHTAPIDRPLTAEHSAQDVAAVLRQLDVPSADVLGFSAGGHTALALAMEHPALVHRLIAASTFFTRDAMIDGFWEGLQDATVEDMPEVYKDIDRRLNPDPRHLERLFVLDSQRMLSFPGWTDEQLGTIATPTLVLVADRDVIRPEHAVRMSHAIPRSRLMIVPGAHGDYLGEVYASGDDLGPMCATLPFLLRFLDETP
ncbi:alpha/beta fold hydrolase [Specibacter cremeus]|uniref:alpha/beta fold hydrolase n=1 Tax=Specibacter cremeus TaxID=1629051 RepID=UPI001F0C16B8|nr:alpha/beta hydrolase [Specibacter cremeus]